MNNVLHTSAIAGAKLCLKEAILNGALPTTCTFQKPNIPARHPNISTSALQKALLGGHFEIVKFLQANYFIHESDLPVDPNKLFYIMDEIFSRNCNNDALNKKKKDCLGFLKNINAILGSKLGQRLSLISVNAGLVDREAKLRKTGLPHDLVELLIFRNIKDCYI